MQLLNCFQAFNYEPCNYNWALPEYIRSLVFFEFFKFEAPEMQYTQVTF